MKRLFKFRYPKLLLLGISIILAYIIFRNNAIAQFVLNLKNLRYVGILVAGYFFSFGFTTPFAIGFFITSNPENFMFAVLLGGVGALLGDLSIYKLVKFSFMDEFKRLNKNKEMQKIEKTIFHTLNKKVKIFLTYVFAGLIIASPLPDEIGVTMLTGLAKVNAENIAIISFIFNSLGIAIMLLI